MSVSEGRPPRSPANFCAQAADLVRVRTLPCTRNGRSRNFRQKNTYVLAQFPSDPLPGLLWPRCLPDASQMSPRCLPDASQMPLRCLSDASRCFPDASRCFPKKTVWGAGVIGTNVQHIPSLDSRPCSVLGISAFLLLTPCLEMF